MNNLNLIFLEEYKQLDKLCSELYDGQPGVTSYINGMKNVNWNDSREISNWKSDLSNLIRLRHIRNHLAHTEGAFDEKLCTSDDVNWVKDFRNRILRQTDPLAMLRNEFGRNVNGASFWANSFLVISMVLVIITVVCIIIQKIL
jgi:hypothetical protein